MKVKLKRVTRVKPSASAKKMKLLLGHSTDVGTRNRVMLPMPRKDR